MKKVNSDTAIRTGIRYRSLRATKSSMEDHSSQVLDTSITPLYIFGKPLSFALESA